MTSDIIRKCCDRLSVFIVKLKPLSQITSKVSSLRRILNINMEDIYIAGK